MNEGKPVELASLFYTDFLKLVFFLAVVSLIGSLDTVQTDIRLFSPPGLVKGFSSTIQP